MPGEDYRGGQTDEDHMRLALEQAELAAQSAEVPVGAVLVLEGAVLGRGQNRTRRDGTVAAHAEILALSAAERSFGDFRLEGSTLYVTLEPCLMCLGAILQARVSRLVYGAAEPKSGALCSRFSLQEHPCLKRLEISAGVLADEAAGLLSTFFSRLRADI